MKKLFIPAIGLLLVSEIFLTIYIVNFLQAGCYRRDSRGLEQILGKPVGEARMKDVEKLNKDDLLQLFFAANTPDISRMKGHFNGKILDPGFSGAPFEYIYRKILFPGQWEGEVFRLNKGKVINGYKTFISTDDRGRKSILHEKNTDSYIAVSAIDRKNSLHMNFDLHRMGIVEHEHDEMREINRSLFICMLYMPFSGGAANPIPAVLYSQDNK